MSILCKLRDNTRSLLACPNCKSSLLWSPDSCSCPDCGQSFAQDSSRVWDFTPRPPSFIRPVGYHQWLEGQIGYEKWWREFVARDNLQEYLNQISGVTEIYQTEFQISGSVLDVGGGVGTLRHFLPPETDYLVVDPHSDLFRADISLPHLKQAYPSLSQPCNFVVGLAEQLPVRSGTFDWVHMRSVIDHFANPYIAFLEAHRVLKPGGRLLIGIGITNRVHTTPSDSNTASSSAPPRSFLDRLSGKIRRSGITGTIRDLSATLSTEVRARLKGSEVDHHIWHPDYDELLELIQSTHFEVEKLHWQKPPHDYCLYLSARRS